MSDFYHTTQPVARLKHQCVHCKGPILPGESHKKFAGVWMGDFQDFRFHLDCELPLQLCQQEDGELCDEPHHRGKTCVQMAKLPKMCYDGCSDPVHPHPVNKALVFPGGDFA